MALLAQIRVQPNPVAPNQVVMGMMSVQNTGPTQEVILSLSGSITGPAGAVIIQTLVTQPALPIIVSPGQQAEFIFMQAACDTPGSYAMFAGGTAVSGSFSAPSLPFSVSSNVIAPGPVLNLAAEAGDTTVDLTWDPPEDAVSAGVTGYLVVQEPTGLAYVQATTGRSITGLTNGTPYTFNVIAVVTSEVSATPAVPTPLPGVVLNLLATPGDTIVDLAWDPPANAVAAGVTGYHVVQSPGSVTTDQAGTTLHVTGLSNGTPYTWNVNAVGTAGSGSVTPVISTPVAPVSAFFAGVTSNASLVVLVGDAAASSPDAITYTARTTPGTGYNAVATDGTNFVAVGFDFGGGTGVAALSTNGTSWSSKTIANEIWHAVAWNGSVFAAVGTDNSGAFSPAATSPDGVTWTARTITDGQYLGIAWNSSVFCAVGIDPGGSVGVAFTSPTGVTWTSRAITTGIYNAVAWNGSVFCAVGSNFALSAGVASTSPTGTVWTSRTIPAYNWTGIAWNGSVFAAVGSTLGFAAGTTAATSPDGITWTSRTIPSGFYQTITWDSALSLFVAVGDAKATSPDGTTWTAR